jgi:hypothetical protein
MSVRGSSYKNQAISSKTIPRIEWPPEKAASAKPINKTTPQFIN